MTFLLVYHPLVVKDIAGVNRNIRKRLAKAIGERLSSHPESYGKPLRGDLAGYWTLRVGDYRVVYRVVRREVWIFAIINRRDVYSEVMTRLLPGNAVAGCAAACPRVEEHTYCAVICFRRPPPRSS